MFSFAVQFTPPLPSYVGDPGALYMAALAARLTAAGKPLEVMRVACMRKLLVVLNARVKHGVR